MVFLKIGIFGKPRGLKGEIKVEFYVDSLSDLDVFSSFYLRDPKFNEGHQEIVFDKVVNLGDRLVAKVQGVDTREEAEKYRHVEIWVDSNELPELGDNEFYYKDLEDSKVFFEDELFGQVESVVEIANHHHLLVLKKDLKRMMIPIVDRYFKSFDKDLKRIQMENLRELF